MKNLTKPLCTLALVMALGLVPGLAAAQTIIDLTTAGNGSGGALCTAPYEHNGACFEQGDGGVSSGTGIFDPFYQVQKANQTLVSGVNTAGRPAQFETVENGAGAATELLLSTVTQVDVGGTRYREFFLDINQNDAIYDILDLQMYTDDQPDLLDLDPTTRTWGASDTGPAATLIFWLDGAPDGNASVRLDYTIEAGSGKRDMRMLIPDDDFGAGPECDYGQTGCDIYVYLYSQFFENNDGFEEWSTAIQPFIQIEKTAEGSLEEDTQWTIDKSVSPETWDLFTGDSGTSEYTINVDKTVTPGNITVTGTITMSVPELLPDGDENAATAEVQSLTDIFEGIAATSITCDGDSPSPPFDIDPGETVTCDYVIDLGSETTGTNTATAVILNQAGEDQPFVATADVNSFAASPAPGSEPGTINVTDTNGETFGPFSDDAEETYERTFSCDTDEGTNDNTASIDETDDSDDASVQVNCYQLEVTKDAETKLTRTFEWTIEKTVTPAQWDLFTGDTGTSEYEVTWTKSDGVDSGFMVMGEITIANPHPTREAELTAVTDEITPGPTAATVDCDGETSVPAGGELVCSYEATPADDSGTLNTATATQQNYAFDSDGVGTADGTTDYSGTADVDFTGAEVMEINASVDIEDTVEGTLAEDETDSGSTTYERTFACDGDEGTHDNTASVIGDDDVVLDSDDASVTVNCYQVEVTKDADESYTRTWTWTIAKSADQTDLTLSSGQLFTVNYEVTVDATSSDNSWAVSGTITIANEHPTLAAELTQVVDAISGFGGTVTVDCGGVTTVPASDSIDCTYSAGPEDSPDSNPFGELNTATATQQNYDYDAEGVGTASGTTDYSGTAAVAFGDPTSEIDECIDVSDTNVGDLGTVCADQAPETFNYSLDFGQHPDADVQLDCGPNTHPNVADFITNDTETTDSDDWTVDANVNCDPSCTLTQGYWKTHNPSFAASHNGNGPPPDDTWLLLDAITADGSFDGENELFFDTGLTWFEVFNTAPKGNAYFNLAHQYMAAVLNMLNGASSTPEVDDAIAFAEDFFMNTTIEEASNLKGKDKKDIIDNAGILADYNEGTIGPGHCDEDASSTLTRVLTNGTAEDAAEVVEVAETQEKAAGTDPAGTEAKAIEAAPEPFEEVAETPDAFAVGNYPDPFNPTTTIRLELPEAVHVSIIVYDVLGRQVARVADGVIAAGVHEFAWNASNLPSGTYFYMVRAGQFAQTKTMVLAK